MASLEEAIALCDPSRTAIACTVDETVIDNAPPYRGEELVGTVPSVV
jgi:hypothetical protein